MGCDIHLHVEVKIDDQWFHYNHIDMGRNYKVFGHMAGVRCHIDPITYPKGLPDDISAVTKIDVQHWGQDAHTHSWLSSEEVSELTDIIMNDPECCIPKDYRCCDWWGYFFGNSYAGFTDYPDDKPDGIQDFRFVFWFDN
jgi:hypothetical protein